jgi:hypothetical protein
VPRSSANDPGTAHTSGCRDRYRSPASVVSRTEFAVEIPPRKPPNRWNRGSVRLASLVSRRSRPLHGRSPSLRSSLPSVAPVLASTAFLQRPRGRLRRRAVAPFSPTQICRPISHRRAGLKGAAGYGKHGVHESEPLVQPMRTAKQFSGRCKHASEASARSEPRDRSRSGLSRWYCQDSPSCGFRHSLYCPRHLSRPTPSERAWSSTSRGTRRW